MDQSFYGPELFRLRTLKAEAAPDAAKKVANLKDKAPHEWTKKVKRNRGKLRPTFVYEVIDFQFVAR